MCHCDCFSSPHKKLLLSLLLSLLELSHFVLEVLCVALASPFHILRQDSFERALCDLADPQLIDCDGRARSTGEESQE